VFLHYSIISNVNIYQDRLETNSANIKCRVFFVISVIVFEVNIVTEHVNVKIIMTIIDALLP